MKYLPIALLLIFTDVAMACPGCIGSNPRDQYLVYILGVFILLTYIPIFYLFRIIKKHRHFREDMNEIALRGSSVDQVLK